MPVFSYDQLRRWPDVEDENLYAVDATDRLIIDQAAGAVRTAPHAVVVIGDRYGALTLGAAALNGATGIRVHQDPLSGELALANNATLTGLIGSYAHQPLDADLVRGARVVLVQLPKSLAELQEVAETVAGSADPDVVVYAGGRVKHMTPAMNDVLQRCFTHVSATLARQKSRVLVARGARPGIESTFPRRQRHDDLDIVVCGHGAAFGGTKIDLGTRFLLGFLDQMNPGADTAVDLGCGTGVLAVGLARSRPGLQVSATDDSASAVASTVATAAANGLGGQVTTVRDDAMASVPDASVGLVVCNPPFHLGASVHAGAALRLFAAAGRVLRPGGELWTVFNTHLAYASSLRRLVGPTKVVGRDARYTVTVSRRSGR
ncbi:MAG: class I SAM-dependent methyltransferase [Nocardioidaceae bacterium]